jgi:hypothetical protein
VAVEQPAGLTSISIASVVAEIAGESCADVTPPMPLSAIESSKITEFAPDNDTCMVVVPGYVLVTGPVPLLLEGVWLALAIVARMHKASMTESHTQNREAAMLSKLNLAQEGCFVRFTASAIALNCFINDKQCRDSAGFEM